LTWVQDSNGLPFIANSNQGSVLGNLVGPNRDTSADDLIKEVLSSVEVPEKSAWTVFPTEIGLHQTIHNKKAKKPRPTTGSQKNPIQ